MRHIGLQNEGLQVVRTSKNKKGRDFANTTLDVK